MSEPICWKHRHKTEKEARRHMIRCMQIGGKKPNAKVSVYHCDICGYWHFGHQRENRRTAG